MQRLIFVFMLFLLVSCKSKNEESPEADNWIPLNKKVFTDKLNVFGLPDTTYTKIYTFENFNVKDSNEIFAVSTYDNDRRLVARALFLERKDGSPLLASQSKYSYSGKYLATVVEETDGVVTKDEKYTYDTSGKILRSSVIRMKNFDSISEKAGNGMIHKESLVAQGYDTLNITYKYDAGNKNVGGDFLDNRGNLVRKDVNVYSGTSPIATYNLGPNGDTIQRIAYEQKGNVVRSQSENKDYIIVTAMNSGYLTGKITFDKKRNEKIKQEWTYENGRLTGEKFYINQQKNSEQ